MLLFTLDYVALLFRILKIANKLGLCCITRKNNTGTETAAMILRVRAAFIQRRLYKQHAKSAYKGGKKRVSVKLWAQQMITIAFFVASIKCQHIVKAECWNGCQPTNVNSDEWIFVSLLKKKKSTQNVGHVRMDFRKYRVVIQNYGLCFLFLKLFDFFFVKVVGVFFFFSHFFCSAWKECGQCWYHFLQNNK